MAQLDPPYDGPLIVGDCYNMRANDGRRFVARVVSLTDRGAIMQAARHDHQFEVVRMRPLDFTIIDEVGHIDEERLRSTLLTPYDPAKPMRRGECYAVTVDGRSCVATVVVGSSPTEHAVLRVGQRLFVHFGSLEFTTTQSVPVPASEENVRRFYDAAGVEQLAFAVTIERSRTEFCQHCPTDYRAIPPVIVDGVCERCGVRA